MSSADTGTPADEEATTTVTEAPADEAAQARLDELVGELGDTVVGSHVQRGDVWIRVAASGWKGAGQVCKANGYDYFCFLSGLDWMPSTSPNPRALVSESLDTGDDEPPDGEEGVSFASDSDEPAPAEGYETGVAGGDSRFQVFARLYSTTRFVGVTLKADLDDDKPRVDTWTEVYKGADWHERETWEMYGFVFDGHPNLAKLYLPGEFEGFPLRKDYPLLSREVKPWPGLVDVEPMPEVPEPTDSAQEDSAQEDSGGGDSEGDA